MMLCYFFLHFFFLPVNVDISRLSNSVASILSLGIHGGVPVAVVEDDGIGAGQVNSYSTASRRQNETEDPLVGVESLHQYL